MAQPDAPERRSGFEIAIICALAIEHDAVESLLDEDYYESRGLEYGKAAGDRNAYTTGRLGNHPVVLAYMPGMGKANAAAVAAGLRSSFTGIRLALVVGVCGGAPQDANGTDNDIFLGDVIISTSVLQIDFGRQYPNASAIRAIGEGNLGRPNPEISAFLQKTSGFLVQPRLRNRTSLYMNVLRRKDFQQFGYPGAEHDNLYPPGHRHKHQNHGFCATCDSCETQEDEVCKTALHASCDTLGCDRVGRVCYRSRIPQAWKPSIHFGPIASGDMVMKSAKHRDDIVRHLDAIAFEMEGAGTWNIVPTVVVKAVCDYADSHKSKKWQGYAAIAAAACSKALLGEWTSTEGPDSSVSRVTIKDVEQTCLRSLSFETIDARYHNIKLAHQKTCDWLFNLPQFHEWQSRERLGEHNGVLWVKANPGAGKSTLMKHILLHCQHSFPNHLRAAYFFNARGVALEKTPFGMFRSLLYQLLSQSPKLLELFMPHFLDKQKKHGDTKGWEWHLGELRHFLLEMVARSHIPPTYMLVDAIDECEEHEVRELVSFLEELSLAATASKVILSICLSSRYYPTINMRRKIELTLESQRGHDRDITIYVSDKLSVNDPGIQNQILKKAKGIFMWVVLVVQLLNQAFDEGRITAMEEKLHKIPGDLEEVFRLILIGRNDLDRSETLLMLQWVLYTTRPLQPQELYFAVLSGIDPANLAPWDISYTTEAIIVRYITNVSKGLVEVRTIDDGMKEVQFIHESVNDFLLRNRRIQILDSSLGLDINCQSHGRLADCCISYISMQGPLQALPSTKSFFNWHPKLPFLRYSVNYVLRHINLANPGGNSPSRHLRKLQEDRNLFIMWQRLHKADTDPQGYTESVEGTTLLYTLAFEEDACLVKSLLLETGINVNASGGIYGTALQAAVVKANHGAVQVLLENHAATNVLPGFYGYPLQTAALFGDPKAVRQLLDASADVNARGGFYGHALQAACVRDAEHSTQVVKMLLEAGADIDAVGGFYGTAVQAAAVRAVGGIQVQTAEYRRAVGAREFSPDRPDEIIDLLWRSGANIDAHGGEHSNALRAAVLHQRKQNVRKLLDCGASVDTYCLAAAAKHTDKEIMHMLQEARVRDDWSTGYYNPQFSQANQFC